MADAKEHERFGVCSNYLEGLDKDDEVQMFIRSAPGFRMPKNNAHPMLLIGPGLYLICIIKFVFIDDEIKLFSLTHLGTGTAPFRSFWQELAEVKSQNPSFEVPKVWLFFGCRTKSLDLYADEKREMMENGILNRVFLALSREKNVPKVSLSKCQ